MNSTIKALVFTLFFIVFFKKVFSQDTLLLKSRDKIPCSVRKVHFLNERFVKLNVIENDSIVTKKIELNKIEYFYTRDTVKLKRISNYNEERLKYFRCIDSSGTHIDSKSFLTLLNQRQKPKPTLVNPKKQNITALLFFIGPSFYMTEPKLEKQPNNNFMSFKIEPIISFGAELAIIPKTEIFGFSFKGDYNLSNIYLLSAQQNQRQTETKISLSHYSFSFGPSYNNRAKRVCFSTKVLGGLIHQTVPKTRYENHINTSNFNSVVEKRAINASYTSILINPSFDLNYYFDNNVSLFTSLNFKLFNTRLNTYKYDIEEIRNSFEPIQRIERESELPVSYQSVFLLDYRVGFLFDL